MRSDGTLDEAETMEELIAIFFFMSVAAVLILRPVTKKLGLFIEAVAKERMAGFAPRPVSTASLDAAQVDRIANALDRLNSRIDLIDDRMSFVERLVESRPAQRLTG